MEIPLSGGKPKPGPLGLDSLLINSTAITQFNILNLIYIGYYLKPKFLPFGAKPLSWAKRSIEDGYKSYELP